MFSRYGFWGKHFINIRRWDISTTRCKRDVIPSLTVVPFTKEVNPRLAKRPLVFNGHLANRGLTSLVKEATGVFSRIKPSIFIFLHGLQRCGILLGICTGNIYHIKHRHTVAHWDDTVRYATTAFLTLSSFPRTKSTQMVTLRCEPSYAAPAPCAWRTIWGMICTHTGWFGPWGGGHGLVQNETWFFREYD